MVKTYSKLTAIASVAISLLLLAGGCSQKVIKTSPEVSAPVTKSEQQPTVPEQQTAPTGSEESLNTPPVSNATTFAILEGRTTGPMLPVYFDFDQSNIRADQKDRIEKNAQYLKDNTGAKIVIQGNCDERGTSEYNMALGERRAVSAKKYLVNLGVQGDRINTISYGEEKPLNHGHDELAWSQNRRDDFVQSQ